MRITKASPGEKINYKGLHPLFGHVKVTGVLGGTKGTWTCAVEYLGEGKDEPNYEAIAPDGMHFAGDRVHTILGTTQQDLLDQIDELEECTVDCA